MKNSVRSVWILMVSVFLATACQKQVSEKTHNDLVDKYNKLLGTSHQLQIKSEQEEKSLQLLDYQATRFSVQAVQVRTRIENYRGSRSAAELGEQALGLDKDFRELRSIYDDALTQLTELEKIILEQQARLYDNAGIVYKDVSKNQKQIEEEISYIRKKSRVLGGIASLLYGELRSLEMLNVLANNEIKTRFGSVSRLPPAPPVIRATPRDREVSTIGSGSAGLYRDEANVVNSLADESMVVDYASRNSFSRFAAEDSFKISSSSGGLVGFADKSNKLPEAISDMVSHFKKQVATNADDLELALVIDYSGSMSDKIKSVINGLVKIVDEMKNVRASGRTVKIGIVTFGQQGREKANLDLTTDLTEVQRMLNLLLSRYDQDSHSTDPGEASYHGLNSMADNLSWKSQNRMAVLVTDEESWEMRKGMTDYVDSVKAKLRARGIQTRIYAILVKNWQ